MDTVVLRIDHPANSRSYRARLLALPGQTVLASARFALDLAPKGMAAPRTAQEMRDLFAAKPGENAAYAQIGAQLYALVGQKELHEALKPPPTERRLLLDIQPPELRSLPWELMVRDGVQLMRVESQPICRGPAPGAAPALPDWPLRVLIVDGGERPNENIVQAGEEIRLVRQAISTSKYEADIDLLVIKPKARHEILEAFEEPVDEPQHPHQGFRPHILHFIGHGVAAGDQSYLELHDTAGASVRWTAADIPTDFAGRNKPRLVLLNACRTAAEAGSLWSVMEAFRKAEIPAVIGMQAEISGRDGRLFAAGFYRGLIEGKPLDQAVVAGRKSIWERLENSAHRLEWAAPTVEVTADPDAILAVGRPIENTARDRIGQITALSRASRLVVRQDKRAGAWRSLAANPANPRQVVVVRGDPATGKSKFIELLMQRCVLCNHNLRYVNLKGTDNADALTVLRRICEGDSNDLEFFPLAEPLPTAAFDGFRAVAQEVFGAPLSTARMGAIQDIDARRLFKAFQDGLEQAAAGASPLVIVLDHLSGVQQDQFRSFLLPHLVLWCASRSNRNILLVLLLRRDEYEDFGLDTIQNRFKSIDIDGFPAGEWSSYAWEYVWRNLKPLNAPAGVDPIQEMDNLIKVMTPLVNWPPQLFGALEMAATFKVWSKLTS